MPRLLDRSLSRDILRFACFLLALTGAGIIFLGTPALSLPTLCSIVIATLLSPCVATLERRGISRGASILLLFVVLSAAWAAGGFLIATNWQSEWFSFQSKAPDYFSGSIARISEFETRLKASFPVPRGLDLAGTVSKFGDRSASVLASRLPGYMSSFLSCVFLVPILTFCFLSDGRTIRRKFFQLVPNRFFESVFIVTHGVASALSDYLRAKLIEAFLVGTITTLGLALVHSPYAIVLGIWAGVTNILPYIGPPLGAIPGIAIAALDSHGGMGAVWSTTFVYGFANLVDSLLIFPGIVAKLVKLPPLVLIASVVLGQYYGGMIGMLVSIPIAAAVKVILSEIYVIVYGFSAES